jgi:hypothetical protein
MQEGVAPVDLTSPPFAVFLLLWGLFWTPRQAVEPDYEQSDDPGKDELAYRRALRRQAIAGFLRLAMVLLGALLTVLALVASLAAPENWNIFWQLLVGYTLLLLMVYRAEVNRRLATMLILSPLWLILLPRYADFRGAGAESDLAVLLALGFNYLLWLTLGRWFPVGSSDEIIVWGMEK